MEKFASVYSHILYDLLSMACKYYFVLFIVCVLIIMYTCTIYMYTCVHWRHQELSNVKKEHFQDVIYCNALTVEPYSVSTVTSQDNANFIGVLNDQQQRLQQAHQQRLFDAIVTPELSQSLVFYDAYSVDANPPRPQNISVFRALETDYVAIIVGPNRANLQNNTYLNEIASLMKRCIDEYHALKFKRINPTHTKIALFVANTGLVEPEDPKYSAYGGNGMICLPFLNQIIDTSKSVAHEMFHAYCKIRVYSPGYQEMFANWSKWYFTKWTSSSTVVGQRVDQTTFDQIYLKTNVALDEGLFFSHKRDGSLDYEAIQARGELLGYNRYLMWHILYYLHQKRGSQFVSLINNDASISLTTFMTLSGPSVGSYVTHNRAHQSTELMACSFLDIVHSLWPLPEFMVEYVKDTVLGNYFATPMWKDIYCSTPIANTSHEMDWLGYRVFKTSLTRQQQFRFTIEAGGNIESWRIMSIYTRNNNATLINHRVNPITIPSGTSYVAVLTVARFPREPQKPRFRFV